MSKKLKIKGIILIFLWIIGSMLLFNANNGKVIIMITTIIIIAGFNSQITKERKINSKY